jgi:predicted site-specific integrase-resolvase
VILLVERLYTLKEAKFYGMRSHKYKKVVENVKKLVSG